MAPKLTALSAAADAAAPRAASPITGETSRDDWVPFHQPSIGEEEIEAVVETLRSGWLTTGPRVKQFERQFADFVGAEHAVAVNSCTAALHLALEAAGVRAGDEVIIPTITFAATGEVVTYLNARPVLVDCDADTLTIDPTEVERAVTPRTKAIIPVHFGGQPCEMDALCDIAKRHGLVVIEDAAHALPAGFAGRRVGTIGDLTCFSFYATKTITTGEGGMITTARDDYAARMRMMSLHGLSRDAWTRYAAEGSWRYDIVAAGYKYNLTDIAAALGLVQLKRCNDLWAARSRIAAVYDAAFGGMPEIRIPVQRPRRQHAWHLYVIQLELERLRITRDDFVQALRARNIGCSVHFIPLHLHSYYDAQGWSADMFPRATAAFERIVSLPLSPSMSDQAIGRVIDAVTDVVRSDKR